MSGLQKELREEEGMLGLVVTLSVSGVWGVPGLPNELREEEGMLGLVETRDTLVKSSSMFEWLEAKSP